MHRLARCFAVSVLAAALITGCRSATLRPYSDMGLASTSNTGRRSAVLGAVEIAAASVGNAHEAVVRLRPEFLERRGQPTRDLEGAAPIVYVNGVREGGPEMLRSVPVAAIREIRYLSGSAAASRFGKYDPAGVISVETWR